MGLSGISKSTVSKLCKGIGDRVGEFLNRPLTGDWPYVWLDATDLKVRQGGRIVPVAAIIAVAANTAGRREIIGSVIRPSEAETCWTAFLRSLRARRLDGVKLVISDAHTGLKAAIGRVFVATWQHCRVHWMRNALAHVYRGQHTVGVAAIRQAFDQPDRIHTGETWHKVAEQLPPRWPKRADLMDTSEHDVLAYMSFPPPTPDQAAQHEPDRAPEQGGEAALRCRRASGIPSERLQECPRSPTRLRSSA
jgi:putative transposase